MPRQPKTTRKKSRGKGSKRDGEFTRQIARAAQRLVHGRVLAIDPASGGTSMPGWAVFDKSSYVASGTIAVEGATIQERLADLRTKLMRKQFTGVDVVVVERIRGRLAHVYLTWSVGVTVSAFAHAQLVECPVSVWKKYIKDDNKYEKTDEADAVAIGCAAIDAARSLGV